MLVIVGFLLNIRNKSYSLQSHLGASLSMGGAKTFAYYHADLQ